MGSKTDYMTGGDTEGGPHIGGIRGYGPHARVGDVNNYLSTGYMWISLFVIVNLSYYIMWHGEHQSGVIHEVL